MVLEYALQDTLGLYLCEHLIFMQVQWVYCLVYVIDMVSLIILYRNRPSNMSPPSLPEVPGIRFLKKINVQRIKSNISKDFWVACMQFHLFNLKRFSKLVRTVIIIV